MQYSQPKFEGKIITNLSNLPNNLQSPVVFTNGCFDIIHRGHVTYLAQAKTLGKTLIVALNSDESVKTLAKGDDRPINNLANRMAVIASLADVDYVIAFNESTPLELIKAIKPDVLVKGGDWQIDKIVGAQDVIAAGGKVYSIPFLYTTSTTNIINKIKHV